ncbi:MAG: DUF4230 domain-containing protein [Bacteroidetes bacterium]|nr:DUF4230 domain-containing protein [Bacteroidota bacterium]
MSNRNFQTNAPGQPGDSFSPARMAIFLIAIGVLGFIVYKYYFGNGNYTNIPKEVQIKYVPSDFKADIDYDNALPILSNPVRYSREFDQLIHDFNLSLLSHVANRMNLSDSLKIRVRQEYEKHHPYLQKLMFNDFVSLQDSTSTLYDTWYQNKMTGAVEILNEVASKYTCFLINQIFATLLPTQEGKIYVKGESVNTPCGVALTEGLQPMIARLKERATVQDFTLAKGVLQERVEKAIAELGTMEIRDRKGIGTSKQTKVLGVDVSSTEMEMSAISILKVGFKLDKFFEVSLSSKSGIVTVTLPEPEILSHEVYPRIDKLDIGWMREIDQADFNKNMDLLRKEFRREALESDVMAKAKQRAIELMDTMMTPIVKGLNGRYQLKVRFKGVVNEVPDAPEQSSEKQQNKG